MKKKYKFIILVSLALFLSLFFYHQRDYIKKTSLFQKAQIWFRFRFDSDRDKRYYYNDFIRVYLDVYDDQNFEVLDVSIANRRIYLHPAISGKKRASTTFSLRPGFYRIRWSVIDKTNNKRLRFSYSLRADRYIGWQNIVIRGDRIYKN